MTTQMNQTVVAGHGAVISPQGPVISDPTCGGRPVEEFIDKREVARRLKKRVRTIDNWMKRGILPYYKIGRSVCFRWSEIEAALARTCRICRA